MSDLPHRPIFIAVTDSIVTVPHFGSARGGCASSVKKKLKATEGVEEARVSFEKKEAWIKYDDRKVTVARLREVINGTRDSKPRGWSDPLGGPTDAAGRRSAGRREFRPPPVNTDAQLARRVRGGN